MAETSFLPLDIIEIILSKLLFVKSLLRFKSVSKSWDSIISDPLFVKNHHQQSKSQGLFVHRSPTSGVFTLVKLQDRKFETLQILESPYKKSLPTNNALCRCEGVLFLTVHSNMQVLWNPSTRTHKKISIPFQHLYRSRYGLCPDPTTDGFKVVMVNRDDYSVYSTKNNSLIIDKKKFDGLYAHYGRAICFSFNQAVCVGGGVYWPWSRPNIIYFDPRDDKFKILQKPEYVHDSTFISLMDLGGSLCLSCEDMTTIKIWINEKGIDNYSWKVFITMENVHVKMGFWDLRPQCLLGNKIIFRQGSILVVYSPLEKTFEQFTVRESSMYFHNLVSYVDSSVITRCKSKRKCL